MDLLNRLYPPKFAISLDMTHIDVLSRNSQQYDLFDRIQLPENPKKHIEVAWLEALQIAFEKHPTLRGSVRLSLPSHFMQLSHLILPAHLPRSVSEAEITLHAKLHREQAADFTICYHITPIPESENNHIHYLACPKTTLIKLITFLRSHHCSIASIECDILSEQRTLSMKHFDLLRAKINPAKINPIDTNTIKKWIDSNKKILFMMMCSLLGITYLFIKLSGHSSSKMPSTMPVNINQQKMPAIMIMPQKPVEITPNPTPLNPASLSSAITLLAKK